MLRARGIDLERAELKYRLAGRPVTHGLQAEVDAERTATDHNLKVTLDLLIDYIPPGAELSYYWTLTAKGGESVDTPTKSFTMLDEHYQWQDLSDARKRVSLHWYDGNEAFGQMLLDVATESIERLERDIGAGLQRSAHVWVYGSEDDLLAALPLHTPEFAAGRAFPDIAIVMAAIANDENAEMEGKRIIPHEISHLVLYQATRNPYNSPPAWLDEGLAVYNQETKEVGYEDILRQGAEEGRIVPLRALSGSFDAEEEALFLSYAQSHSVVEFILNDSRYGPDKLSRTVAAFRDGVTYDEALQAGLGLTVDELDRQWRASLPYEVREPGSAPQDEPAQDPAPARPRLDLSPGSALVWVSAGIFALLFVAGGVLTAVMIARRRHRA